MERLRPSLLNDPTCNRGAAPEMMYVQYLELPYTPSQARSIVPLLAPADGTHGHDVPLLPDDDAHVSRGTLSSRYVPSGHVAQLRPSSADSPPSGHAMHSPAPSYGLNLPAPHGSQLSPAPASPEYPAGHTQLDALVLPSGDAAPLGHALHASGPAASL